MCCKFDRLNLHDQPGHNDAVSDRRKLQTPQRQTTAGQLNHDQFGGNRWHSDAPDARRVQRSEASARSKNIIT